MSKPSSLITDRKAVRHLGAGRSGTRQMWLMRVTAVALVPLTIVFAILLLRLATASFDEAVEILASPFNAIVMLLFTLTGIYHMMLGMRVVIEDYVHNHHAAEWALIANILVCGAAAASCLYAILKISVL